MIFETLMATTVFAIFYNLIFCPIFFILVHLAAPFHPKIRIGLFGRYKTNRVLRKAFKSVSSAALLIHCASMGEFEHIKPFIHSFKRQLPDSRIIVMFFSPSGYENVREFPGVDLFIYSPFDWWLPVLRTYRAVKPSALIIAKHDVWPNQIWIAHLLKIPCLVINASLHDGSKRLRPISRFFHKMIYDKLDRIITISENDCKNYRKFIAAEKIVIAGDTKFEQVILRMEESKKKEVLPDKIWRDKKVIVAGSIWPEDEEYLLPAFKVLLEKHGDLLIILCPHEPTDFHLSTLKERLLPMAVCLYSELGGYKEERIIIIDKIGLLATLYSIACAAYVGGSFKQNIHNVLEPAVYVIPVIFGPVNRNSHEAQLLKECGGGIEVHDSVEMTDVLNRFLTDEFYRRKIGAMANKVVMENTGATQRTIDAIMPFLRNASAHFST
jgi:3-deoxy-D-manno-octulosonic-acid transferase